MANLGNKDNERKLVEQYYDRFAEKYKDNILTDNDPSTWTSIDTKRKSITERINVQSEIFSDHFKVRNGKVLDIGCGFGRQSLILARTGFNVTACDSCQPLLDIAKTLAEREGLNIDFNQMDAINLQFRDGSFDYVLLLDVIEHIPEHDRGSVLSEASRVLKNGGITVISLPLKTNPVARMIKSIGYYYKQPWIISGVFWRLFVQQVTKLKILGKAQITEEHPFHIPSINEMIYCLAEEFEMVEKRNTKDTAFLIFQKK